MSRRRVRPISTLSAISECQQYGKLTGVRSPHQISERLDRLITNIRSKYHESAMQGSSNRPDVLLVAHGHILRAFAMRWIGRPLESGVSLILEAGGVGTLSYEHQKINEPAILLGGSFMADVAEHANEKDKK